MLNAKHTLRERPSGAWYKLLWKSPWKPSFRSLVQKGAKAEVGKAAIVAQTISAPIASFRRCPSFFATPC